MLTTSMIKEVDLLQSECYLSAFQFQNFIQINRPITTLFMRYETELIKLDLPYT